MTIFASYRNQSIDFQYKSFDWFQSKEDIAMKKIDNSKASAINIRKIYAY